MLKKTVLVILFATAAGNCYAQEKGDDVKFYRLDFVVKEVDAGKVVNARNYSMTISNEKNDVSSTRSGDKIPVQNATTGQTTYLEMGVNIDCRSLRETFDGLALSVSADISGAADGDKGRPGTIIRNTRWNSKVLIPLRKPTMIFSSDDANSKMQVQLQLTATPIR